MSDNRYLLVKRGLYYGPNNAGYTGFKERAGRYPASDADEASGVAAVHEDEADEIAPKCFDDLARDWLNTKLSRANAEIKTLRRLLVKYGDRVRMATSSDDQHVIDDAFAALSTEPTP